MRNLSTVAGLALVVFIAAPYVVAQDDEARKQSGLPTFIGNRPGSNPNAGSDASLSGTVFIEGLDESKADNSLTVFVQSNGSMLDRQRIPNRGAFRFTNVPYVAAILIVELDGQEIARYPLGNLNPPPLSNRQDVMMTWVQVGQVLGRRKQLNAVINAYERSDDNQKLFDRALSASREKKTDAAIKLLQQIVAADVKDFVVWTELGNLFFGAEKHSAAESAYTKAVALKSDFEPALLNLGKLNIAQKKYDASIENLTKALALAPDSADVNHYLGEAFLMNKKGSQAVIYLNKAIEISPVDKAELHLRLAALYNAANLKDRAINEYKKFLEKVPTHPERASFEKYIKDNSPK